MEQRVKRDPYRLVGTSLGKYHILEFVGVGGMGAVYRAKHEVIEDIVALKILKPDLALENDAMVEFFFNEAKNTRRLNHPYIVKVADAGLDDDGIAFLVMEWLDGLTLEDELKDLGVIPLDRLTILLEQICEGLQHAHATGIIHRDLKPSNIMIVKDHRGHDAVKILDFGIAKALNSTIGTSSSRLIGAPYYSSPEQMSLGATIDHRSDIYSLGVMLFQLLTGMLPFDATTVERLIQQHFTLPPPSLCELRPEISEEVERVVFKALAKMAADRFPTVTDLALALRRATDAESGALLLDCRDAFSQLAVPDASVYLNDTLTGHTDHDGRWRRSLLARDVAIEIRHDQYQAWNQQISILPQVELRVAAELVRKELGELSIRVFTAGSKAAIAGAAVLLNEELAGVTDETGTLDLQGLTPGEVKIEVVHPDKNYVYAKDIQIVKWEQSLWQVTLPARARRGFFKGRIGNLSSKAPAQSRTAPRLPPKDNSRSKAPNPDQKKSQTLRVWVVVGSIALVAILFLVGLAIAKLGPLVLRRVLTPAPLPTRTETPVPTPSATLAKLEGTEVGQLKTNDSEYYQAVLSLNGKMLATIGDKDAVHLWQVGQNGLSTLRGLSDAATGNCVAMGRSGQIVAAGNSDKMVRLWRTDDGSLVNTLRGHNKDINLVMFSRDEKRVISADAGGTVIQWNVSDGKELNRLTRSDPQIAGITSDPEIRGITSDQEIIRVSSDQTVALWSSSNKGLLLWSFTKPALLTKLKGNYDELPSGSFSPNGEILALASNDGMVRLWQVSDGSLINTLQASVRGHIGSTIFSPDAKRVVAGLSDGTIQFWRMSDRNPVLRLKHDKAVYSLSFSDDGRLLASASDDHTIRVWQITGSEQ